MYFLQTNAIKKKHNKNNRFITSPSFKKYSKEKRTMN